MRAMLFVLTSIETGKLVGRALVVPEARYASIAWAGAERLDRRYAMPTGWLAVEAELVDGVPPGPLARTTAIARLLGFESDTIAQYLSAEDLEVGQHGVSVQELDARLTRV